MKVYKTEPESGAKNIYFLLSFVDTIFPAADKNYLFYIIAFLPITEWAVKPS